MASNFKFREMILADGLAINDLASQCPDAGLISVYSVFRDNACESLQALRPHTVGVAAIANAHDGLIGIGLVSFGHCRIQGVMVPYALLNTLMVHPDFRREGVARQLVDWRIEHARSRLGDKGILLANIQAGNTVSHRTVRRWCTQVLPAVTVAPVSIRKRAPKPFPGLTVGPVGTNSLEEFAERLNTFYQGYNFYQPETADRLGAWLSDKPLGQTMHSCLAVRDRQGELLAGLTLDEAHRLRTYHVIRMPAFLRMANRVLHVVPADGILREILVSRFWFRPGQAGATRYLWESVRWQCRGRGTSLMVFFDPRSPLASLIHLKPWSIRTAMNPVIGWQTPVETDRPICPIP